MTDDTLPTIHHQTWRLPRGDGRTVGLCDPSQPRPATVDDVLPVDGADCEPCKAIFRELRAMGES